MLKTRRDCEELQRNLSNWENEQQNGRWPVNVSECNYIHIEAKTQNFTFRLVSSDRSDLKRAGGELNESGDPMCSSGEEG